MAKTELEVRFTLPLNEALLKHKMDAEHKAKEALFLNFSVKAILVLAGRHDCSTFRDGIFRN